MGSKLNKLKANSIQAKVLQEDKMEYFVMVQRCNPSSQGVEAGRQQGGSHLRLCKECGVTADSDLAGGRAFRLV